MIYQSVKPLVIWMAAVIGLGIGTAGCGSKSGESGSDTSGLPTASIPAKQPVPKTKQTAPKKLKPIAVSKQEISGWYNPPLIEPDFKVQTKESLTGSAVKVAVVCFAPIRLKWDFHDIDKDIAKYVSHRLNQHKIKVVSPDRVQQWLDKNQD